MPKIQHRGGIIAVSVASAIVLFAAGCSKPHTSNGVQSAGNTTVPSFELPSSDGPTGDPGAGSLVPGATTGPGGTSAATSAGGGTGPGAKAKPGAKATGPVTTAPFALGNADNDEAHRIGNLITPQSSARKKPYYNGVTENAIQLDFSTDATNCGVNVVNAITAAGGALPSPTRYYRAAPTTSDQVTADNAEAIKTMVEYWNRHAFDTAAYAPKVRALMGDDVNNQFFGRHLTYKIIDGGSNQCPDKATSGSTQATDQDHAFAVFNNLEGASPAGAYNMAAALNAKPANVRPMHFGSLWLSDQDYTKFAPYAWTQFSTGTTIVRQQASYICSRLVGQIASRSPDSALNTKPRVFGFVHTNLQQDKRLADEYKGYLQQFCGKNIITKEVEYDGSDFKNAQQDNANLVLQLKIAGVTTVIMLTEPVQPLFQLQQAQGQNYSPEWIFSSFGYSDSSTVQRLYDQNQTRGSFGTSNLGVTGGFGFGSGDPFAMYHDTHKTAPDGKPCDPTSDAGMDHGDNGVSAKYCKSPGALVTWYYSLLPAIGGMLYAGPDLTPQNLSAGLQAFPTTRYGGGGPTTDPRPALVGAGKGRYGFVVDATEWRWRPDFTSPQPEAKAHWVEYPDCQRHYLQWPNNRAPGWEVGGKNDNAWCGDKNGYPKTLPEDANH